MNTLWNTRSGALLVSWVLASACGSGSGEDASASGPDPSSSSGADGTSSTTDDGQTESSSGGSESSTGDTGTSSTDGSSSGGSSSGGSESESDSTDTEPVAGCPDVPLQDIGGTLAILRADLPDEDEPTTDEVGGGEDPDPNELFLLIDSNDALTCEDPDGSNECTQSWRATVVVPVPAQTPGVYELGTDVQAYFDEVFEEAGECGGGGGSLEGTLEIVAIDGSNVSARLCNTNIPNVPANGSFEAARCQ